MGKNYCNGKIYIFKSDLKVETFHYTEICGTNVYCTKGTSFHVTNGHNIHCLHYQLSGLLSLSLHVCINGKQCPGNFPPSPRSSACLLGQAG